MQDDSITIICSVIPKVNLAFQQNSVAIITEIELRNRSDKSFRELELVLTSAPKFLIERTWYIDQLEAGSDVIIDDIRVELNSEFLRGIYESLRGEMTFTLKAGIDVLDTKTEIVELLAKDEWVGTRILPEILAAFVQPNDATVQTILRDTSKILEAGKQLASIEGYQSKSPRRVAIMVSAVCKLDLSYANPPASFEEEGQRVRLPSKIAATRLATCLDTALLFASCLEQAGLNGLIIFTQGHAFTGCWLSDDDLSSAIIYDAQALRKRCKLNELIVFETTLCTSKPPTKFSLAKQEAEDKLENDDAFVLAIDIKRARAARIKPLSDKDLIGEDQGEVRVDEVELPIEIITDVPEQAYKETEVPDLILDTPEARIENWKRQLLDLTMRNRLLNFTARARAKEEMHIFASLRPEQIDLSRTGAEGIRDLKHFLEYAQRGATALTEATGAPGGFFDSPFEQAVAEKLEAKGWITHSQVGVSGFRVDLGVINPDAPGTYLSAVECDGASYHSSATARDRDFLREQVLRDLGWEVLRIWSTDWWIDSESALERVDEELKKLLEQYRAEI